MVSISCATQSLEDLSSVVQVKMEAAITYYGSNQILTIRTSVRSDGLSRDSKTVPTSYGIAGMTAFSLLVTAMLMVDTGVGLNLIPTTKIEARSAFTSNHSLMVPTNCSISSGKAHLNVMAVKIGGATAGCGSRIILIGRIAVKKNGFLNV
jgi:hypothetical protein